MIYETVCDICIPYMT